MWLIDVGTPCTSTRTCSTSPGLARPERTPASSRRVASIVLVICSLALASTSLIKAAPPYAGSIVVFAAFAAARQGRPLAYRCALPGEHCLVRADQRANALPRHR